MEQKSQRVQKYSRHFQYQHTVDDMMETIRKLNARDIYTLADLQTALAVLREKVGAF